jgi:hypothetical protein
VERPGAPAWRVVSAMRSRRQHSSDRNQGQQSFEPNGDRKSDIASSTSNGAPNADLLEYADQNVRNRL